MAVWVNNEMVLTQQNSQQGNYTHNLVPQYASNISADSILPAVIDGYRVAWINKEIRLHYWKIAKK